MFNKLAFIFAAVAFMTGCATIVDGKKQEVTFQSSPAGAEVSINGIAKGTTPLTLQLQKAGNTTFTLRKEGYQEKTLTMETKVNGMFFGNILFGGLPGTTTDIATGANLEYSPGNLFIKLEEAK